MLIGITGRAGVGKDTLADRLVALHGYTKYSLATPIKALLNARFGWDMEQWIDRNWKENGHAGGYSPRSWAQWLGTEVGRTIAGADVWVNLMADAYQECGVNMVVPDVRFDNEARCIENMDGVIIKLERPDAPSVNAHVSEAGISQIYINYTFINRGTKDELLAAVETALKL